MRLVRLRAPGGLENLKLVDEDPPKPGPGELLVRIRASSMNFHDDLVVLGKIPCADGRIPMSDGAGEVIAVGDDVAEFKVADTVVSTFWPYWLGGDMNYKAVPDWGQKAKDLTDGRGVDHVIEVGGPGTLTQSITACRTGGHIALIGVLTGFAGEVAIPALFSNQIRISGISIGSRAD